jgi:hypothetical protein
MEVNLQSTESEIPCLVIVEPEKWLIYVTNFRYKRPTFLQYPVITRLSKTQLGTDSISKSK